MAKLVQIDFLAGKCIRWISITFFRIKKKQSRKLSFVTSICAWNEVMASSTHQHKDVFKRLTYKLIWKSRIFVLLKIYIRSYHMVYTMGIKRHCAAHSFFRHTHAYTFISFSYIWNQSNILLYFDVCVSISLCVWHAKHASNGVMCSVQRRSIE